MTPDVTPEVLQELAPTGFVRVGINYGNPALVQRNATTGEPKGIAIDIARELGQMLDVNVELISFDSAGKLFAGLKSGAWDVACLAIDPERAIDVLFTEPYLVIEGTYMVRADSAMRNLRDVDREGVRIAIGKGGAYDLFLSRELKHAKLVHAPTGNAAFEMFVRDGLEAAAGVRQALVQFAAQHADLRVMDGRFMRIEQAVGTPRPREAGAKFLSAFVSAMKKDGRMKVALEHNGLGGSAAP